MPKMFVFQPSSHTDHITEDGTELQQRPYPFACLEDGTIISAQVSVDCAQVVGVADGLADEHIDHHWSEIVKDPDLAKGRYIITRGKSPRSYASHVNAVESVTVREF